MYWGKTCKLVFNKNCYGNFWMFICISECKQIVHCEGWGYDWEWNKVNHGGITNIDYSVMFVAVHMQLWVGRISTSGYLFSYFSVTYKIRLKKKKKRIVCENSIVLLSVFNCYF